ncbi:MAG: exodeoxyribonuclease VII large subunit [Bacteroidales bacterium]|nr:exodeoxyribonuclease VII large subunit [Bacteroidales bacterium]
MTQKHISLSELQASLREGVETLFPGTVCISAELASVQAKAGGHCYLELAESDGGTLVAKARAVIWRSRYPALAAYVRTATGEDLKPGMAVLLKVRVQYSELYGLTLVVEDLEPDGGPGPAELEKQRTIARLTAEGVLRRQKDLHPAALPYALAVISARDAAGYGDFCRHLAENEAGFAFRADLFEAAMQGETAPASIVDALERIETADVPYDAVLLLRGGGSALDLACFDDYALCFALATCPLPVYTAIGHDRDFHVADMVAYDFVKTPTALADLFIDALGQENERIGAFAGRLALAFTNKILRMEARLDLLASRIREADPRRVLSRGYSLVTNEKGVVLKQAAGLNAGQHIRVLFSDGTAKATIQELS